MKIRKNKLLSLLLSGLLLLSLSGCGTAQGPKPDAPAPGLNGPADPDAQPAPPADAEPTQPANPEPAPAEPEPLSPQPEQPVPKYAHPDPAAFTSAPETANGAACRRWTVRFFGDYTDSQFPPEGTILLPEGVEPLMVEKFNLPAEDSPMLAVCRADGQYRVYIAADSQSLAVEAPLAPIEGEYLSAAPIAIDFGGGSGERGVIFELDCGDYYRYVSYDNFEWSSEENALDLVYRGDLDFYDLKTHSEIESSYANPVVYRGLTQPYGLSGYYTLEELESGVQALLQDTGSLDESGEPVSQWKQFLMTQGFQAEIQSFSWVNLRVWYDESRQKDYFSAHPEEEGKTLLLSSLLIGYKPGAEKNDHIPCFWTLRHTEEGGWQITDALLQ